MAIEELTNKAFENLRAAPGSRQTNPITYVIIEKVMPEDNQIGKPFPLAILKSTTLALLKSSGETLEGWYDPNMFVPRVIGLFIGKHKIYEDQKQPSFTFIIPTDKNHYEILISENGQLAYHGGGDDEPFLLTGIGVESVGYSNKRNTKIIEKKFGSTIKELTALATKQDITSSYNLHTHQ